MRPAQIVVLVIVVFVLVIGYLGYRQSHPQLINECRIDSDCKIGRVCKQPIAAMSLMAIADEHPGLGKWCVSKTKCVNDADCQNNEQLSGCSKIDCRLAFGGGCPNPPSRCDTEACISDSDCFGGRECVLLYDRASCQFVEDPYNKETCTRLGGVYRQVCMEKSWMCVMNAPDAGKVCTDSSQCSFNRCETNPDLSGKVVISSAMSGMCAENNIPCGCAGRVEDGEYAGTLCVD